jgi:hypothetical protein
MVEKIAKLGAGLPSDEEAERTVGPTVRGGVDGMKFKQLKTDHPLTARAMEGDAKKGQAVFDGIKLKKKTKELNDARMGGMTMMPVPIVSENQKIANETRAETAREFLLRDWTTHSDVWINQNPELSKRYLDGIFMKRKDDDDHNVQTLPSLLLLYFDAEPGSSTTVDGINKEVTQNAKRLAPYKELKVATIRLRIIATDNEPIEGGLKAVLIEQLYNLENQLVGAIP